jgi:hypothetical protein
VGVLLFVAACGTSEYDREWQNALSSPTVGPHDLPHLFGHLDGPWVSVSPPDLFTSTTPTDVRINFGPETEEVRARVLAEPGRAWLMTWPEGEVVPTTPFDDALMSRSIILLTDTPLENRWYATRLEIGGPVLGASFVDGAQMARFRPDSYPVVQQAVAADRVGLRVVDLRFSENLGTGVSCSEWRFADDLGPMPCRCIGPSGIRANRAVWLCERDEQGALHIDFGAVPNNVLGVPLRDLEGNELSAIDLQPTGVSYPGGGIEYR